MTDRTDLLRNPTFDLKFDPMRIDQATMDAFLARGRRERSVAARALFAKLRTRFARDRETAYEGLPVPQ